jgi:hypothetical protein
MEIRNKGYISALHNRPNGVKKNKFKNNIGIAILSRLYNIAAKQNVCFGSETWVSKKRERERERERENF